MHANFPPQLWVHNGQHGFGGSSKTTRGGSRSLYVYSLLARHHHPVIMLLTLGTSWTAFSNLVIHFVWPLDFNTPTFTYIQLWMQNLFVIFELYIQALARMFYSEKDRKHGFKLFYSIKHVRHDQNKQLCQCYTKIP